jgi:hypothetical protein
LNRAVLVDSEFERTGSGTQAKSSTVPVTVTGIIRFLIVRVPELHDQDRWQVYLEAVTLPQRLPADGASLRLPLTRRRQTFRAGQPQAERFQVQVSTRRGIQADSESDSHGRRGRRVDFKSDSDS